MNNLPGPRLKQQLPVSNRMRSSFEPVESVKAVTPAADADVDKIARAEASADSLDSEPEEPI